VSAGPIQIRVAVAAETAVVSDILAEAAAWLDGSGQPMWKDDELAPHRLADEVAAGIFILAWSGADAAGTMKFQLEDPLFWPDQPPGEAAYVHRLAVKRAHAGGGVSRALMTWAVDEARKRGRRALRLDCEADRLRLRAVYERFGFRHHSDRAVPPYFVARYEYPL
jgi:GNAT superfamily N-acetyltransferase